MGIQEQWAVMEGGAHDDKWELGSSQVIAKCRADWPAARRSRYQVKVK